MKKLLMVRLEFSASHASIDSRTVQDNQGDVQNRARRCTLPAAIWNGRRREIKTSQGWENQ